MSTANNEYLMKVPEEVRPRLLRAIRQLLDAGRNTVNVAETLCPQASFGKYDGCHRIAIESIARDVCAEANAEARKVMREASEQLKQDFKELFPQHYQQIFSKRSKH